MRPSSPRPSPLTRGALLALPLVLAACDDKPAPAPKAVSVFRDSVPAAPPLPPPELPPPAPVPPAPPSNEPRPPEKLFTDLGCVACHGEGRPFAPRLANARDKPAETVAVWILDPQKINPGTVMPSFAGRLSTTEALALARWIKAGNPTPAKP